jgi:hypothetical protein
MVGAGSEWLIECCRTGPMGLVVTDTGLRVSHRQRNEDIAVQVRVALPLARLSHSCATPSAVRLFGGRVCA